MTAMLSSNYARGPRQAALCCALLLALPLTAGAWQVDETELKATFIWNFVRMVDWTTAKSDGGAAKLTVCALTDSELYGAVRAALKGRSVEGKVVTVVLSRDPQPDECQVLVFEPSEYHRTGAILGKLGNSPVLTIGNGVGFLNTGGMFELFVHAKRVQFNIGLRAVRKSSLEVSARLVRLASNMQSGDENGS